MDNTEIIQLPHEKMTEFEQDSIIVGEQTEKLLRLIYPSYFLDKDNVEHFLDKDSAANLNSMSFFRITCCTADNVDDVFETVSFQFQKLK